MDYDNREQEDTDSPSSQWHLLPLLRVAMVGGIVAVTLGGIKCYHALKSAPQSPGQTSSSERSQAPPTDLEHLTR